MPTALVTGARQGIGWAATRRLVATGWTVYAGVRDDASMQRIADDDAAAARIVPIRLDITDPAHIAALDDVLPDRVDAVVNNAAFALLGPVEGVSIADLRQQYEVNLVGTVAVTQAVLPRLRASKGRIAFVSSTGGRSVVPMEGAYCSSKFAIEGIADALRVELRPWRIKVVVIEPGPTDTEAWQSVDTMIDDMERKLSPAHRDLYARHVAGLRQNVGRFASVAASPVLAGKVIERALTARRPRARYLVGGPAHMMMTMDALLPTRLRDAVGARIAGLE
ncbi:MAG: SDR family NAD(P)-dependent oxidoreductase [Microbacterium sp.]